MTLAHFEVEEFADEVWRVIPSMPTHMASSHGRVKVIPYKGKMPQKTEPKKPKLTYSTKYGTKDRT